MEKKPLMTLLQKGHLQFFPGKSGAILLKTISNKHFQPLKYQKA
ncbi:MAG: hypothetical protein WA116_06640 [Anaerolineaceae bacterium]